MKFARVSKDGVRGIAMADGGTIRAALDGYDDLDGVVREDGFAALAERLAAAPEVEEATLTFLPCLPRAGKVICLGLNYRDHAAEGGFQVPEFPTVFARFASNLIGHGAPILKPVNSDQLDFEGEMVAVIGKRARNVAKSDALSHVSAYSIFNDGSIRDVQIKTPQWTVGKNFDDTGAIGPWLVPASDLPAGGAGLGIETRLNGETMQSSNTSMMIFNVEDTVALLSGCFTLEPGDVLVMGTPAGIGFARKPPVFMKPGDVVEVEIEDIGILRNPIEAA